MKDVRDALMVGRASDGRVVRRPLSPHLQVYRPQITTVLSITHRATGIALSVGTLFMVWWLVAAAISQPAFATVQGFFDEPFGWIILFGWTFSLWYHLLAGIRHLFWDAGFGFDLPTTHLTGMYVVIGSAVLTILTWIAGAIMMWG